jgi:MFS family permease
MKLKKNSRNFHIFHGWYVLAASFVILFLTSGARFTIGVVFKPLMLEFGWSRGAISLAFFLNMTIFALSLIFAGRVYDRYGPKWVITFSGLCISFGFLLIALINSFWQFFVFYGILAAAGMGATTIPLFAVLTSKWFEKARGLAVSLGVTGSCLGQFVLVPLFASLISEHGWRVSYFVLGLAMLIVITSLALLVIRGDPAQLGIQPFGSEADVQLGRSRDSAPSLADARDMGLRDALKTYPFWLFLMVNFACGGTDFFISTHLVPMVTDYGISPATGANMLAWLALMSLAGVLVSGPAADRIGTVIPFAFTFIVRFFLFILVLKYQTLVSFYILACAFGFTFVMGAPLLPMLLGKLYGYSNIGLISGVVVTVHHMSGGLWVYVAGLLHDKTGSYSPAFLLSAAISLMAFLMMILIREKRLGPPPSPVHLGG